MGSAASATVERNRGRDPTSIVLFGWPIAFDQGWARSILLLWAFLISFSRWHVKNKQDTLSEAFARKKAMNDFIVDHRHKIAPLVSGALTPSAALERDRPIPACEADRIRHDIRVQPTGGDPTGRAVDRETAFVQKMFVFQELDNLEFVFDKYSASLIDDSQMLRACQIFESRCLSEEFRHLAVILSDGNYVQELLDLVDRLAVFGYQRSRADAQARSG